MVNTCAIEDINRLIAGDQMVFKRIYDLHAQRIYKYAFHFVKDEAWAEEILQDTFLKLWHTRKSLEPSGDIWLYLYVLCKRLCLTKLRDIKRTKNLQEHFLKTIDYIDAQQIESIYVKDLEDYIAGVIAMLPSRQQEIFRLSRQEGLTHQEIAQRLNISTHTVKNHMVAALKEIRLALDKNDYAYFIVLSFSVLCF